MTIKPELLLDINIRRGHFDLTVNIKTPLVGIIAITGRSGSGKSSLLRSLAGLDTSTGTIKIGAEVWQNNRISLPTFKRDLGYVFQEGNLFPHLNVQQNLFFGWQRTRGSLVDLGHPAELASAQNVFSDSIISLPGPAQVIELFGLGTLLHRSTLNLSGGERQKVAIARALLRHPKMILMDEPLSSLDEKSKHEILEILEHHQRQQKIPIIYVSHDASEIIRLADHVVEIADGTAKNHGPLSKILSLDFSKASSRQNCPEILHEIQNAQVVIETKILLPKLPSKQPHDNSPKPGLMQLAFPGGVFLVPEPASCFFSTKTSLDHKTHKESLLNSASRNTKAPSINNPPTQDRYRLRIAAKDVSISLSRHEDTSILNIFSAVIESMTTDSSATILVRLRLQNTVILAKISERSAEKLALKPKLHVFAQIKAVALV